MQFKELGSLFNSFAEMSSKRFKGISSIEDMNGLQKNSFDEFLKLNSSGVSAYTMNQIKAKSAILELTDSLTAQGVALAKDADFSAKAATGKLTFRKALDENKDSILDIGKALEKSDLLDDVWKQSLQKAKSGGIDEYEETVENILSLHKKVADSIINLGTATTQSTSGLSGLKSTLTGIAASAKSLFVTLATNPLTWITAATVAAIALEDALTIDYSEAHEALDTSTSKYQEAQSELEALKSETESYKKTLSSIADNYDISFSGTETFGEMINKLNNADLSLVDQAEVDKIKTANTDLERQIELQEKLTAMSSKEYINDAKTAMNTGDRSVAQSVKLGDSKGEKNFKGEVGNVTDTEAVKEDLALIEKYNAKIPELEKKVTSLKEETSNMSFWDDGYFRKNAELKSAQDELERYKESIETLNSDLSSRSENIQSNLSALKLDPTANAKQIKELEDVLNSINNIGLSPVEQQMQSINSYFDGSTTSNIIKEQLLEAVQSGESATDALHRMGVTLNDLGITGEGKKAVFDDYFRGLVDSAEEAKEAVKSIDGSVDGVKAAFVSENQDTNWKSMSDFLKQAGDLYKESKIGTDDFQSAVQFIAPKEINPDSTKFDAQAYVKAYEKYKDKIKRYFDSENEKKSAANLQNDLIDKGLAKQTDNGIDWVLSKFKSSADAAKAWGISIEAAEVAMHNLESYGAEFDNVMFSGEGLQSYQKALEQIKGIYDSMDDNSEGKERLKNIIDQSELDDFENNLDSLTKDKIINIQFEYDLATVQQQIDEIKNGMVGSGGTTEQYMSLIASQTKKREMLAEQKGMSKATSDDGYESSLTAFDNLAQKLILEYDTLGESGRRSIQQQQSALLDLQSSYLDLFQRGEVTDWDSFFGTKEADGIISKLAKDTGKSVGEVKDELAKLTGVDANDIEINAKVNDEATSALESMISISTGIPKEIITELLAEDKASDATVKVLSEISGIPEEKITEINATNGASGVLTTVLSEITGIPESKVTELIATDDVSKLAKLATKSVNKIPKKSKTNMTATDGVTPKANSAKSALAGVKDKKVTISAVVSNSVSNAITKVKNALGSVGTGASFGKKGGKVKLNGTAHKSGTAKDAAITPKDDKDKRQKTNVPHNNPKPSGHALATGTIEDDSWIKDKWKTKKDEVALTGEVGQEIIVHGNTWQTVGDNGAEFAHIPAGSVVFNAKQTEELLKKGSINSRGKAYLSGTAYGDGMPNLTGSSSSTKKKNTKKKSTTKSKGKDTTKKDSKKFKETFDWIEVAIDRIERAIDRLNTAATSIYRSWSVRNKNLKSEISSVNKEIKIQEKGFKRYNKEADKVSKTALKKAKDEGFTKTQWDSLTKKVRDGKIDISTIKNEKLANRIKEYKEW